MSPAELQTEALIPPRLIPGDRVRLVSPASSPGREWLDESIRILKGWELEVEVGDHVLDQCGYMAGTDEDRLADLNAALRDPGVRAIITTTGGAGAYRIADGLDFEAARRDPKPLIGFSDITNLHLALWRNSKVVSVHGMLYGVTGEATRRAVMTNQPLILHRNSQDLSAEVSVEGKATGVLLGGHLGTIVYSVGAGLPSLEGAILFLEAQVGYGPGVLDESLFQLVSSGALNGVRGIAIGHLHRNTDAVANDESDGWTVVDVLRDRLGGLGVPILSGLPVGHDPDSMALPLGSTATIDTATGSLTVAAGVR